MTCGILIPHPGIEPGPLPVERQSLNHWICREVPVLFKCETQVWTSGIPWVQVKVHRCQGMKSSRLIFFFLIEFRGKFFSTFLHTHLQPLPTNTTENKKVFGREESLSSIPLLLLEIRQSVHVPGSENARILNPRRHTDDGQHNLSSQFLSSGCIPVYLWKAKGKSSTGCLSFLEAILYLLNIFPMSQKFLITSVLLSRC